MSSPVHKPYLRGHFHQAAFFVAIGACAMLLAKCDSMQIALTILVYSIGLTGMLGVSALYHRPTWQPAQKIWMKRIDHAMIFVMIAGTGTAIARLALSAHDSLELLLILWAAAVVGILKSLFWVEGPKWVSAVLYVAVGWISASYWPELSVSLGRQNLFLLLIGGIIYSIGALIYASKRPNPWPAYFGYHEIFHALVIVAAVFHFIVIQSLVV